jgi:stage V sporulation protein S
MVIKTEDRQRITNWTQMDTEQIVVLKVSPGSDPRKVGSAIAHSVAENKQVHLRAIGAGAVNQSMKSVAIAAGWTGPRGIQLAIIPAFIDVEGREGTISGMTFKVIAVGV